MNRRIKDLMERLVIKMLEEDLNNNESIISSQDGKTVVTMKQNSMVSLLLYLQLTSEENGLPLKMKEHDLESLETTDAFVSETDEMTENYTEEEQEEILEKIIALQQKNKQIQQELAELLPE